MQTHPQRPPDVPAWGVVWAAWAAFALLLIGWDLSGADLVLMQAIGDPSGFAWRHHPWLTRVLHDGLRQGFMLMFLALCIWAVWTPRPGSPGRRERAVVVLAVLLSLMLVSALKRVSLTSCPWDLQVFGGQARYLSHWRWGQADGGPGHCFPGGHASGALAFMAVALPWWRPAPPVIRSPRTGLLFFATSLCLGVLAGGAQTLRGAHYPSHTGWTALLCGATALMTWRWLEPWMRRA